MERAAFGARGLAHALPPLGPPLGPVLGPRRSQRRQPPSPRFWFLQKSATIRGCLSTGNRPCRPWQLLQTEKTSSDADHQPVARVPSLVKVTRLKANKSKADKEKNVKCSSMLFFKQS